ncbi:Transmembrane 9 super member 2 [Cladophialophora chaetospira]|uniref:Transmembrane 9 superfamily member n=1 Tax=Cladophialophora chaetospira TaxID=386627 RepID=A0AA38XCC1_9EURO|nr:Transmembrane 9 super member 2 [Cladophialophora chaetospira]
MAPNLALAFAGLLLLKQAGCFYLPGVSPSSYSLGDKLELNVNTLTPSISRHDEQIHAVVAFDYYHPAFHFCQPEGGPQSRRESLGSIIFGDRIQSSPFDLRMGMNETCKIACKGDTFDDRSAKFVNGRIEQAYKINFFVDGLPAAELREDPLTHEQYANPGFPLGKVEEDGTKYLNNHWDIIIDYHMAGLRGKRYRVVGVLVQPSSHADAHLADNNQPDCGFGSGPLILDENGGTSVTYTYSVYWRLSDTAWATRWDRLLHIVDPKIHWFSLINSAIFVIFLLGMVSTVLVRALRKDIARYNRLDNINLDDLSGTSVVDDDVQEDSGWKLVHGDVFRPPRYALLMSVLLGSGAQLFVMTAATVAFAMLGFLSPSNRGWLTSIGLLLYTVFGCIGGYVSSRAYKSFGGENWKLNIAATPIFVPTIVFGAFFLLNLFVWAKGASGAVPFTTMMAIIAIWFLISVPLSVAGAWYGFKSPAIEPPTRVNQIPRQIPPVARSLRTLPSLLLTGILPFCAIFVELYFIMTSLWESKIYYMFGFLFICYALMIMTCACTTILLVYFLLCAEDYRWQWRAFFGAGMTGGYVFLHAVGFWITRVSFGSFTGTVLYVGYSALISFLVSVLTGTIGYLASYAFVYRIYGSIKVD